MDLKDLVSGIPVAHRKSSSPGGLIGRRQQELEALDATVREPLRPTTVERTGTSWLAESVSIADPSAGFPDEDLLVSDDVLGRDGMDALAWYVPFHEDPVRVNFSASRSLG
jgi:hypothetical protein